MKTTLVPLLIRNLATCTRYYFHFIFSVNGTSKYEQLLQNSILISIGKALDLSLYLINHIHCTNFAQFIHSYSVFYHNNKHSHLYSSPDFRNLPRLYASNQSYLHAFMKLVPKSECNAPVFVCRHLNLTLFECANKKMTSQSHTSNSSEKPLLACKSATCLGKCFIGIAPTSSQGWEKTKNIFMQNKKPVTYNEVYMQAIHKTS